MGFSVGTATVSAAVAGIHQIRYNAGAWFLITFAANIQRAIFAVLAVEATFGIGATGVAGFAVCFIQIAAMGAGCLGAVFAVCFADTFTILTANTVFIQLTATGALCLGAGVFMLFCSAGFIGCAGSLFLCLTCFANIIAGNTLHCCHEAAVIRGADMVAVFCHAAGSCGACMVARPAFRCCFPIGTFPVDVTARDT